MRINLNEIPKDGLSYQLNRHTGELNEVLRDLIGNTEYSAEFTIIPLGTDGTFDLSGSLKTKTDETCGRCGDDFKFNIDLKFKELLFPRLDTPRDGSYAKANHFSDLHEDGPSIVEYSGHIFEVGEYIHEAIALEQPTNPMGEEMPDGKCGACGLDVKSCKNNYDEDMGESKESPFAALKNFKPN